MKRIKNLLTLMFFLSVMPSTVWAQEDASTEADLEATYADIDQRMGAFQEELKQLDALSRFRIDIDMDMPLTDDLLEVVSNRLKALSSAMTSYSSRWDAYSQAQQVYIADNEDLLSKMAEIQQERQAVSDTLTARQQQYDQLSAFAKAEKFIWAQDNNYRRLYKQATQYSLSPKLAARLEKTKAEEQALFTDIQTYFDQAKGASEAFPGLKIRMKAMEKKFFELQSVSTKIQEMVYKPFIQRIKDYLLGLAAVAILLMFLNLLSAKIKTLKQAREQAKKMKEMMDGQHNYPTI